MHPFVLIAFVGLALAGCAFTFASIFRFKAARAVCIGLGLIFLLPGGFVLVALNPHWIDARFRTYRAFHSDIRDGMTRDEVFAALDRHYPPNGPRKRPQLMRDETDSIGFFMNPEKSREPNCEGIFLTLEAGRVITRVYSPD